MTSTSWRELGFQLLHVFSASRRDSGFKFLDSRHFPFRVVSPATMSANLIKRSSNASDRAFHFCKQAVGKCASASCSRSITFISKHSSHRYTPEQLTSRKRHQLRDLLTEAVHITFFTGVKRDREYFKNTSLRRRRQHCQTSQYGYTICQGMSQKPPTLTNLLINSQNGDHLRKEVCIIDDQALTRKDVHDGRYASHRSSAIPLEHSSDDQSTELTVQMALHPTLAPVQVQTCVFGDQTISTTIVLTARQDRRRVSSHHIRSRSKSPPSIPRALNARHRSYSQNFAPREPSGKYECSGPATAMSVSKRTTRVSSMKITDGMKSLTLEDYDEDRMDYTWG